MIARTGSEKLEKEYTYIGNETCCADGSCQMPCPMNINTGTVTDAVRTASNSSLYDKAMSASADRYGAAEKAIRSALKLAVATERIISPYPLIWGADFLHKLYRQVPHWSKHFPMPAKVTWQETDGIPDFIYFPACVTRIFGASSLGKDDMITVMLRLAKKAGLKMALPKEMHGQCCSQIWEHKGDPEGQRTVANKTVETFYEVSLEGTVPIVCDTTSCTHTLLSLAHKENLFSEDNKKKYDSLKIVDITTWLDQYVMPKIRVTSRKRHVLLHPTCASRLTGGDKLLERIAGLCAEKVEVPDNAYCCGAAGDRGFLFPEVAKAATRDEKSEIARKMAKEDDTIDGCYSLARTCEISLMDTIERPYESIVYLVDETTE